MILDIVSLKFNIKDGKEKVKDFYCFKKTISN